MKKLRIGVILSLILVLLAGCTKGSSKFEPTKSSLYLKKDGSVVSADIEVFEKEYYNQEELTAFVEEQVIAYNDEVKALAFAYKADTKDVLPITIEKLELADKTVTLILNYETVTDYLQFNTSVKVPDQLYIGTLADGKMAGYDFEGSFIKVKDGTSIGTEEAIKNDKQYVLVLQGEVTVQLEGSILYRTDKATIEGDNTVTGIDDAVSYIIFK